MIPNGIDPRKFERRSRFVEKNDKLKILCVARFDRNKKYESLIYSMSKLKRSGLNVEAYFIGSISNPRYFGEITQLIKQEQLEQIIKLGVSVDDASLADCYLSCDLFVLASSFETSPLVILEAMYAGLPIVATGVGGIPELIEDGVNGFLVPANDPTRLYEAIVRLLRNDGLRHQLGTVNKTTAKRYSWDKIAASTYNVYRRLIQNQGHRS
jgi:glycosyltransferase involved in cell wall biosynthesis